MDFSDSLVENKKMCINNTSDFMQILQDVFLVPSTVIYHILLSKYIYTLLLSNVSIFHLKYTVPVKNQV